MTRPRVPETGQGIQGEFNVTAYDQMQRRLRDKGWIETNDLINHGITQGCGLEIGPGPGYLGLKWLKHTQGTTLKGLDISPDMVALAERNAREYGLAHRVEYVSSSGSTMPFDDNTFDAAFTSGSLHEWTDPRSTFDEMWRVVKPSGKVFISDLRRDMFTLAWWFLRLNTEPKEIRPRLDSSINAAYTPQELRELIQGTKLKHCTVSSNPIGLILFGTK
jgi:ubiquinone/menaquinone biosynthesis C-methylase UbiE